MNGNLACESKRREETYTGRYLRGLRNQNDGLLVNLCESKILKTSELARTLFPAESTNNKNYNNSPQSSRKRMHLGKNITYERWLSQPVSVL